MENLKNILFLDYTSQFNQLTYSYAAAAAAKSRHNRVWLFSTLWTVAYEATLSIEFSRQEYWSGLPRHSLDDLPNPGIKPRSLALQAYSFYHLSHQGILIFVVVQLLKNVWLLGTPWTATQHASLSFTISQSFVFNMYQTILCIFFQVGKVPHLLRKLH